jgi:hypothetical protein
MILSSDDSVDKEGEHEDEKEDEDDCEWNAYLAAEAAFS